MITADTITDEQIRAIRDAACECRPRLPIESDDHAASHDCDVQIYDACVTALEATDEESFVARCECAAFATEVLETHTLDSAYKRALYKIALNGPGGYEDMLP